MLCHSRGGLVAWIGFSVISYATERSVAISRFWHEIASSKFSIFPRNDGKTDPCGNDITGYK